MNLRAAEHGRPYRNPSSQQGVPVDLGAVGAACGRDRRVHRLQYGSTGMGRGRSPPHRPACARSTDTRAARAEADRLLSLEPGATLVSVSTWADEVRGRSTAKWRYIGLPSDDCSYVRDRDCADGACVVEAIEARASILKSTQSDAARLAALKFVVHLVADVHQPLHASGHGDKGGGLYQVRAFGRGTTLHVLWDSSMAQHRLGGMSELARDAQASQPSAPTGVSRAADWAQQSCRAANTQGFYPDERLIGQAYVDRWDAPLVQHLGAAARRLAGLLNSRLRANASFSLRKDLFGPSESPDRQ